MDTTAAAELGFGELDGSGAGAGGGLGFWHSGPPGSDQWRNNGDGALLDEDVEDEDLAWDQSTLPAPPDASPASPSGGFARRQTPGSEPPAKMLRAMPDGNATAHSHGGGLGFSAGAGRGHGSGNFAGSPSPSGAGAGTGAVGRGRGMGSIFYKTKLCSRFRSGNCPYNSSCNFAHGMEELRKPPPGWEEFVASQELPPPPPASSTGGGGGGGGGGSVSGPGGAAGPTDSQVRFHKTRPCKKYFGEGNCPYGEKCNFLHDEQSVPRAVREAREAAVAGNSGGGGGGGVDSLVAPSSTNEFPKEIGPGGGSTSAGSAPPIARPSSWKTRLCNKWETTGHCPCGDNCHFAHGSDELQRFGGGLPDPNTPALSDSKSGGTSSMAVSLQQKLQGGASSSARSGSKGNSCWRGPNEISTIYGDWWVEDDFWQSGVSSASHESAELETDLWKETQRRTHIPTPPSSTPRAVPFFRRTTSLELSRQTPDSH